MEHNIFPPFHATDKAIHSDCFEIFNVIFGSRSDELKYGESPSRQFLARIPASTLLIILGLSWQYISNFEALCVFWVVWWHHNACKAGFHYPCRVEWLEAWIYPWSAVLPPLYFSIASFYSSLYREGVYQYRGAEGKFGGVIVRCEIHLNTEYG